MDRYALVVAATQKSWEAQTELLATQQETRRIPITFNRRVIILAAYPSVVVSSNPAGLIMLNPTLDDINVYLDISGNERFTSRFDDNSAPGLEAGTMVTLGGFRDSTGGARILNIEPTDAAPTIGVVFSWKAPITGPITRPNVIVGLQLHCQWK
jgi:hypothetical protein